MSIAFEYVQIVHYSISKILSLPRIWMKIYQKWDDVKNGVSKNSIISITIQVICKFNFLHPNIFIILEILANSYRLKYKHTFHTHTHTYSFGTQPAECVFSFAYLPTRNIILPGECRIRIYRCHIITTLLLLVPTSK